MTTDELNVALFGTKLSNVGDGDVEKEPMFRIGDCVIRVRSYCQDNSRVEAASHPCAGIYLRCMRRCRKSVR